MSGSALSWSNQWNACAETTTSANASGKGIASALPASTSISGTTAVELLAHLLERLYRRNPVPERDEGAGELSGSRPEIDDVARLAANQPADGSSG